jgi:hypothetical protein
MADKHFEQQVQDRMDEFKLTPSAPVWMNIEAQLKKDKRRRRLFFLLFACALLGIGTLVYQQYAKPLADSNTVTAQEVKKESSGTQPSTTAIADVNTTASANHSNQSSSTKPSSPASQQNNIQAVQKAVIHQASKTVVPSVVSGTEKKVVVTNDQPGTATVKITSTQPGVVITTQTTATSKPAIDSTVVTTTAINDTVTNYKADIVTTEAIVDTTAAVPEEKENKTKSSKKWQSGFQLYLGLADVRENPFPSQSFQTESRFSVPNSGSTGGPATIVNNEYSVRNNIQWGVGYNLRKPIFKHTYLATGIHYQYSSFNVLYQQKTQVFSPQLNAFQTTADTEQKQTYHFHYAVVPVELQWPVAKTQKGMIRLSTGIQNQFLIAGSSNTPSFIANTSAGKAVFYQPVLSVIPFYEWNSRKANVQLGWYVQYGLNAVYKNSTYHWWQTGLRLQYYFQKKN